MNWKRLLVTLTSFSLALPSFAGGIQDAAKTPPMGWNSWDCYGTSVTETEVKANADYMAKRLKSHGWQYAVVDIQWLEPEPLAHHYRENARHSAFGGDLPSNDKSTESLLTNDEVLTVDQKGRHGYLFMDEGESIVWVADAPDGRAKYVAVFNVGNEKPREIAVDFRAIGAADICQVRDLWGKRDLGVKRDGNTFQIAPHGSGLYRLRWSEGKQ